MIEGVYIGKKQESIISIKLYSKYLKRKKIHQNLFVKTFILNKYLQNYVIFNRNVLGFSLFLQSNLSELRAEVNTD